MIKNVLSVFILQFLMVTIILNSELYGQYPISFLSTKDVHNVVKSYSLLDNDTSNQKSSKTQSNLSVGLLAGSHVA